MIPTQQTVCVILFNRFKCVIDGLVLALVLLSSRALMGKLNTLSLSLGWNHLHKGKTKQIQQIGSLIFLSLDQVFHEYHIPLQKYMG